MIRVRRWHPIRSRLKPLAQGLLIVLAVVFTVGAPRLVPARSGLAAAAPARPPVVDAAAAILVDARTGRTLFALNEHRRLPPASTTKIITALLAAKALPLDALVAISERAASERSGAAIGLERGEWWRVDDLLHAMLLHSANDAAVALAEAAAGSLEAFAARMNARARALGAKDTTFITPNGRYDPQHLTSAYDLALMAKAALANPVLARIVSLRTWQLTRPGMPPRVLVNTNRLLWQFRGANGVKTGWIAESGRCLVGSATRNGRRLIVVLLNAPNLFADAGRLLDYGFGQGAP